MRRLLDAATTELSGRLADLHEQQRTLRRSALGREKRGALLFMFGAILSGVANLVP